MNILIEVLSILVVTLTVAWMVLRPAAVLVSGLSDKKQFNDDFYVNGVSMIIPCHNESESLKEVVCSVLKQKREFPLQIVLVENNSTDDTYQVIRDLEREYPEIITGTSIQIPKGKNPISMAMNHGISLCSYPIVIRMDADTVLDEGSLIRLIEPVATGRAVTTASNVRASNVKQNLLTRLQGLDYYLSMEMDRRSQRLYNGVLCCSGALQVFWLKDVLKIGGYNEETNIGEDMELTFRLHQLGKIEMTPEAVCFTEVPFTLKSLIQQRLWWARIGLVTVFIHKRLIGNRKAGKKGMLGIVALPVKVITTFQAVFGIIVKCVLSIVGPTHNIYSFFDHFLWLSLVQITLVFLNLFLVAPVSRNKQGLGQWWLVPIFTLVYQPFLAAVRFVAFFQGIMIIVLKTRSKRKFELSIEYEQKQVKRVS